MFIQVTQKVDGEKRVVNTQHIRQFGPAVGGRSSGTLIEIVDNKWALHTVTETYDEVKALIQAATHSVIPHVV